MSLLIILSDFWAVDKAYQHVIVILGILAKPSQLLIGTKRVNRGARVEQNTGQGEPRQHE